MKKLKYSSGLKSTAFWFIESRKVAELMLEGYSKQEILDLALEENIFQVENVSRKKEIANGVYRRLSSFSEDILEYFLRTDTNSAKVFGGLHKHCAAILTQFLQVISVCKPNVYPPPANKLPIGFQEPQLVIHNGV